MFGIDLLDEGSWRPISCSTGAVIMSPASCARAVARRACREELLSCPRSCSAAWSEPKRGLLSHSYSLFSYC